jgi:hypothetical protein
MWTPRRTCGAVSRVNLSPQGLWPFPPPFLAVWNMFHPTEYEVPLCAKSWHGQASGRRHSITMYEKKTESSAPP